MDEYLTTTTSTCGDCGRLVPARVHIADGAVWFDKDCPDHGPSRTRVYGDAEAYLSLGRYHRAGSTPLAFGQPAAGCPDSCGLCPNHEQHVCMPIIEVTDHCDLACPVCLVRNRASRHLDRADVAAILDRLIATEGRLDVVNLSGGEPTTNPHFREIVEECLSRNEVLYVSVSTNGLNLLTDESLLAFLAERGVVVALQFDGLREDIYERLRGRPLLESKLRLIDRAGELDARMSLTMTVAGGVNDGDIPDVLELFFSRDHLCSMMLQPAAYVGTGAAMDRPERLVGIPEVLASLDGACGGQVAADDFSPLPCSHPACFSLAFFLRVDSGQFVSIKKLTEIDRYLDMIANRALFGTDPAGFEQVRDAVYDLWSGPAAARPDSEKALRAVRQLLDAVNCCGGFQPARVAATVDRSIKSVFIHHFMDRDTFDLSRARKCCNVYPLPDGRLMPACVYNCLRR